MIQGCSDAGFILEDGKMVGLCLGWDAAAEHEIGIEDIWATLGMGNKHTFGLARNKISICPKKFVWYESPVPTGWKGTAIRGDWEPKQYQGFWLKAYDFWENYGPGHETICCNQRPLWTGWSNEDLGAFSCRPEDIEKLKEIHAAFLKCEVCVWRGKTIIGANNTYTRAGLCIGIIDRMNPKVFEYWTEVHRAARELELEVQNSGIEQELKAAGKNYFALRPARQQDGSIRFWLNPMDQQYFNAGWFTFEELRQWCKGKGPVVKEAKTRASSR